MFQSTQTFLSIDIRSDIHIMNQIVLLLILAWVDNSLQQFTMKKFEAKEVYLGTANVVQISRAKRYTIWIHFRYLLPIKLANCKHLEFGEYFLLHLLEAAWNVLCLAFMTRFVLWWLGTNRMLSAQFWRKKA